jgi:poly-gamma-glutamate capsule biosynthesis protein CapA/YwtB (metallophosphatase superfamily)
VSEATLIAVGDVAPDREDPRECFSRTRDLLTSADFAFCQLETSLANKGVRLPQARHAVLTKPNVAPAMREAGFTAVSFAGNHSLDWGNEAFFETIANLNTAGMDVIGAGANIVEARRPVIQEANGVRIAFLAYSTILPQAYWAEANRPGVAPMRAHTVYEAIEHDQPGTPARIHTFPHREDLAAMCADIRAAKQKADVVAVSHHWGIHFVPYVLADYQPDVGRAAIDAGADIVLGHHAHILKGVEVYRGKPILYSLCNFATDLRMDEAHANSKGFREIQKLAPRWEPDFDSLYNFPEDARMSIAVKARLSNKGLVEVALLPLWIDRDAIPTPLKPSDPRFKQVLDYLETCCRETGRDTRFRVAGDVAVIEGIG